MSMSQEMPRSWILVMGEWRRSLKAENKAESTIRIYTTAVCGLGCWMVTRGLDLPLQQVERRHIEGFIVDVLERTSAGNAHTQYRSLRTFFWLASGRGGDRRVSDGQDEASVCPGEARPDRR
jgi:integrase/recombinase XerC